MKILLLMSSIIFTLQSSASIYLEPYLGYTLSGKLKEKSAPVPPAYDYKNSGYTLGARIGYGIPVFAVGLEYAIGSETWDEDTTSSDDKVDKTMLGLFVTANIPLFRAWGTYFFDVKAEDTNTGSGNLDSGDELEGSGFALGVGYTGLPFIAINLEYRAITYDNYTDASTGASSSLPSADLGKMDENQILLSVSLPLKF